MTAYHPTDEAPTERLLHIYLEPRPSYGGDHRHINLRVIRRAMSHVKDDNGVTRKWYDDENAVGYRNASWANSKTTGMLVDDLGVRGQIDAYGPNKLRDGKPYGNEVMFYPHRVDAHLAKRMADTFAKLERAGKKLTDAGHVFNFDDYADAVRCFALSLGIKRIIIQRAEWLHADYSEARAFHEMPLAEVKYAVDDLLGRIK